MTLDKARVGKISKQWSGLLREAFTDADFFGISFPEYLDVRMKAVMIGACFLIVRIDFLLAQRGEMITMCKYTYNGRKFVEF